MLSPRGRRLAARTATVIPVLLAVLALAGPAQAAQPVDFGTANPYTVGGSNTPSALAVADFNADGHKDAVVPTNLGVSEVSGTGDGGFAAPISTTMVGAGTQATDVAQADFNGDGKRDVVRTDQNLNAIEVGLGQGNGAFDGISSYDVGAKTAGVTVGNFDNSGGPDVVTADWNFDAVTILLNNNDNTGHLHVYTTKGVGAGSAPDAIASADFDHDGNLDLAVAERNIGKVAILFGNGDGSFDNAVTYDTSEFSTGVVSLNGLAADDLDGDGVPDLVLGGDGNTISVFINDGHGTFAPEQTYPAGEGDVANDPRSVAIGDLNGDGVNDVVAGDTQYHPGAAVWVGNGDGTFAPQQHFGFGDSLTLLMATDIADLDGDHGADLLFVDANHSTVISLLNQTKHPAQALTGSASDLTPHGATLNGTVNPHAQATSYWFEYGTSTDYTSSTPVGNAGSGGDAVLVSASVNGLAPSTTYHYHLVANNGSGRTDGADRMFTTPAAPAPQVDLSVTSTDTPHSVIAGGGIDYAVSVHNGGPDDATGVKVVDPLPTGVTFDAGSSPGCSAAGGTVTCPVGALANGGTTTVHIAVTTSAPGTVDNTVTVLGDQPDSSAADNSATTHTTVNDPESVGCTIIGTAGNDVLTGTSNADVICGLGGNDQISSGAGDDTIKGQQGNDTLSGGAGKDKLYGGGGDDRLIGGNGSDKLEGQWNHDYLNAVDDSRYRDQLSCGDAADTYRADTADRVAADCESVR